MSRFFIVLIAALLQTAIVKAQISQGGIPHSFTQQNLRTEIQSQLMPAFDVQAYLVEDSLDQVAGGVPYRFGKPHDVSFNLQNSGTWETLENGDRLWRLRISSPGAYSINLLYDHFYMPEGAEFFIYNEDHSDLLGAFTSRNNNPDGTFSSFLTRGETTILEYYEPQSVAGQGIISIERVVHGYRQMFGTNERGYGDSGWCNINVNCPEGDDWQDQKRGVAMILLSNGTRWCSGSMINNTAQDETPYFLTANHCRGGENNWIIMFNYESPGCENQDGPLNQTIQYTTLRAFGSASDFALVELSEVPPAEYGVYYAGWSRVDEPHDWSVGIHHPSGDIKKISFDHDPVTSSSWGSGPANTHWRVGNWEEGTTEPGSSGSPLYDPQQRITGQLHGGTASCSSITYDAYGKFAVSWDLGSNPSGRLKDWLDPTDSGVEVLDGFDPNDMGPLNDANLFEILSPNEVHCAHDSIRPVIVIQNTGAMDLESVEVSYFINQQDTINVVWEGLLETGQTDTVYFDAIQLEHGEHLIRAFVSNPNGVLDDNPFNDNHLLHFSNRAHRIDLHIETVANADLISWQILNDENEMVFTSESLSNDTTYHWSYCMAPGCYQFVTQVENDATAEAHFSLENFSLAQFIADGAIESGIDTLDFCLDFPAASFIADQDTICSGTSVAFQSLSIGAMTWLWEFEGGQPESSTEEQPEVYYEEAGVYTVSLTVTNGDESNTFSREEYLIAVICTSLDEQEAQQLQASISPNPGTGRFMLSLNHAAKESINVRLLNAGGQLVYNQTITPANPQHYLLLDISDQPDGLYILQLQSSSQNLIRRLIKQ